MCCHPRNYGWLDSIKEIKNNIDDFYRCRSRFHRSFHLIIIRHFFRRHTHASWALIKKNSIFSRLDKIMYKLNVLTCK